MNSLRRHVTTPIRQWLSDRRTVRKGQQQLRTYHQAYYGFWEPQEVSARWFTQFLQRPAFRQLAKPAKINYFSVFCRRRLLHMVGDTDPRVFFTGENLANYPAWADHALDEVDLALGFSQLSADNYLRFPLWLLDLFPANATLPGIQLRLKELDAAASNFAQRRKFAALVARHDNNGVRSEIADLLAGFGQVDYPGTFRNNIATGLPPGYGSKINFLQAYRFNICPENSDAAGYVTEKLWHAIAAGCIPVYWGSGNSPEPNLLNPDAFLVYTPGEAAKLSQQIEELLHHPDRMVDFAQQSRFLPEAAAVIHQYFTDLEQALLEMLGQ